VSIIVLNFGYLLPKYFERSIAAVSGRLKDGCKDFHFNNIYMLQKKKHVFYFLLDIGGGTGS
jgi:hypothetical protein